MSSGEPGKIVCDGCGRRYTWKPQLAGKTVKCKCGAAITVPRDEPVEVAPDGYDLADVGAADAPAYTPAAYTPPAYSPPASADAAAPGARSAGKPGPSRIPGARQSPRGDGSAKKNEVRKIVTIAVGLVLVIGLVIGAKFAFQAFGSSGKAKNLKGMDAYGRERD